MSAQQLAGGLGILAAACIWAARRNARKGRNADEAMNGDYEDLDSDLLADPDLPSITYMPSHFM